MQWDPRSISEQKKDDEVTGAFSLCGGHISSCPRPVVGHSTSLQRSVEVRPGVVLTTQKWPEDWGAGDAASGLKNQVQLTFKGLGSLGRMGGTVG